MDKVAQAIFKTLGYVPSPSQKEFHDSEARFKFIGAGCFTEDLEVLTRRGWIRFSCLAEDEQIYTHKPNTPCSEYQKIKGVLNSYYEGPIYRLKFGWNNLEMGVTPEHRFLVTVGAERGERQQRTKDLNSFRTAEKLSPLHKLVFNSSFRGCGQKSITIGKNEIPLDKFAAFMGWYLSEGNYVIHKRTRNVAGKDYVTTDYRVEICQKKEDNFPAIIGVMKDLPYKFFHNKCCDKFVISDKDLTIYCSQFGNCYSKFIPQEIKDSSLDIQKIFWDNALMGDGSARFARANSKVKREVYYTCSERYKDDVQEILVKMGFRSSVSSTMKESVIRGRLVKATVPCFCIEKLVSKTFRYQTKEEEQYKGQIYCLSVLNETFFVRKEGRVFMTGNSRFGKSLCGSHDVLADILKPGTRGWIVGPSAWPPA